MCRYPPLFPRPLAGRRAPPSTTQQAEFFATSIPDINTHTSNILKDCELQENSVVKDYLTTVSDGKNYQTTFYALDMVLAIGFRVRSERDTQFRRWANHNFKEYMIKGFVMDDDRLKNPDGRPDYFDELLERIRDIRASKKRFYQKDGKGSLLADAEVGEDGVKEVLCDDVADHLAHRRCGISQVLSQQHGGLIGL